MLQSLTCWEMAAYGWAAQTGHKVALQLLSSERANKFGKGGRWELLLGKFFIGRLDNQDSLSLVNINWHYFWQKVLASHFSFFSPYSFWFFFKLTILSCRVFPFYWTSWHAVAPLHQWDAVCSCGLTAASMGHSAAHSNRSLRVGKDGSFGQSYSYLEADTSFCFHRVSSIDFHRKRGKSVWKTGNSSQKQKTVTEH